MLPLSATRRDGLIARLDAITSVPKSSRSASPMNEITRTKKSSDQPHTMCSSRSKKPHYRSINYKIRMISSTNKDIKLSQGYVGSKTAKKQEINRTLAARDGEMKDIKKGRRLEEGEERAT